MMHSRPIRFLATIVTRACLALLAAMLGALALPEVACANHIRASLVAERPVAPGQQVMLAVLMEPEPGWHGYWTNPGDAGLPLALEWKLPKGAEVGEPRFPVPRTLLVQGLMNHVYEQAYAVLVPLTLPSGASIGTTLPIAANARWLACTEAICVPESAELQGTVTVGQGAADARFDRWRAALPAPLNQPATFTATSGGLRFAIPFPATASIGAPHLFLGADGLVDYAAPQAFRRDGDRLIVDLAAAKMRGPEQPNTISAVLSLGDGAGGLALVAKAGAVADRGTPLNSASTSVATLALAVLGAFIGGLILNVMPCVFPILSLKAMALARGNTADAHREALAYAAGVVLACLALGGAMLGLRAAGTQVGWAFQLQDPGVVALLVLLAVAITANFAGVFELPGLSVERGAQQTGLGGAFATGLLAAFVATPCTGPFMAAAMGAALVLPGWAAMGVFAALGLGLALPFLLLGFVPALRRLLPRPGPWMARFRHAMAVPMGLTVVALGWLAWRLGGAEYASAVAALVAMTAALLVFIGSAQRKGRSSALWALPASLVLGAMAVFATPMHVSTKGRALDGPPGAKAFSEADLDRARKSGKPVFAYFTADWCLSCKVNESVAIDTDATATAFRKAGVKVLVGDWTRRDPAITRFLTAQGAAGVPLYLWYPAGPGAPRQLPQVLTPDTLPALAAGR